METTLKLRLAAAIGGRVLPGVPVLRLGPSYPLTDVPQTRPDATAPKPTRFQLSMNLDNHLSLTQSKSVALVFRPE